MVRARFGIGLDGNRAGPEFLRPNAGEIDRSLAIHSRRGGNIGIELMARNDTDTIMLPTLRIMIVRMARM